MEKMVEIDIQAPLQETMVRFQMKLIRYIDGNTYSEASSVLFTPEGITYRSNINTTNNPQFGGPNNSLNASDIR